MQTGAVAMEEKSLRKSKEEEGKKSADGEKVGINKTGGTGFSSETGFEVRKTSPVGGNVKSTANERAFAGRRSSKGPQERQNSEGQTGQTSIFF